MPATGLSAGPRRGIHTKALGKRAHVECLEGPGEPLRLAIEDPGNEIQLLREKQITMNDDRLTHLPAGQGTLEGHTERAYYVIRFQVA